MNQIHTYNKQIDMLLVYGFCNRNGYESLGVYMGYFLITKSHQHLQIFKDDFMKVEDLKQYIYESRMYNKNCRS